MSTVSSLINTDIMAKQHFFLKLIPPRATFTLDMTNEERLVMQHHVSYWKPYVDSGVVLVLGPVLDPKGGYGIAVVGVDAIQEARDLINKGFMTGTVVQDAAAMAEALYITGMNLAVGKIATYGTDYKFDSTGVSIRIPYSEYIKP